MYTSWTPHRAGHFALELEEPRPRCTADRIVEHEHAGRSARRAPRSRSELRQRAVEEDRSGELLAAAESLHVDDIDRSLREVRIRTQDAHANRSRESTDGALEESESGRHLALVDELVDQLADSPSPPPPDRTGC